MKKYYMRLVDRLFKVLCIYEENYDNFVQYTNSLSFELSANSEFEEICQIMFKLKALTLNEITHSEVRKTVLDCISIIDRILSNWTGD